MRNPGHQRRPQRAPRHVARVQVEAAEHHPRAIRQRDHGLAQTAIGPADRRRDVEDGGHAAQQRERQDRPSAANRQVHADRERAGKCGDAEPHDCVRHRRQVVGIEHPVRAHPRIEVFVEGLDADDRKHHAGKAAPEDRRIEPAGHRVGPRGAQQVWKQSGIEKKPVAHHAEHVQEPPELRSRRAESRMGRRGQRWTHWCSVEVLSGSVARSCTNCATRGSCHARWKFSQISCERMRAQVAADERQRVDQLDQPVGEHDQQRGRVMQPVAQLFEQTHLVEMHAHPAAILVGLRVQRPEERFVLRLGRREQMPGLDRIAGVHRAAGVEAVGAELVRHVHRGADFMDVEARRRIVDLDRNAGGAQIARAVERRVEFPAHAHLVEGFARGAVEAHLHRLHAEALQTLAVGRREEVTVGLDLELAAARADVFDHLEEMRMDHRLAARERQVRDLLVQQLREHAEDLLAAQLVAKRLARAALLDAMQAREIAFVGDLPRDVERRTQVSGLGGRRRRRGNDRRCGRLRGHGAVPSSRPFWRRSAMNASTSRSTAPSAS